MFKNIEKFMISAILTALGLIVCSMLCMLLWEMGKDMSKKYYANQCSSKCMEVFELATERQSCRVRCNGLDGPVMRDLIENDDEFLNYMD